MMDAGGSLSPVKVGGIIVVSAGMQEYEEFHADEVEQEEEDVEVEPGRVCTRCAYF